MLPDCCWCGLALSLFTSHWLELDRRLLLWKSEICVLSLPVQKGLVCPSLSQDWGKIILYWQEQVCVLVKVLCSGFQAKTRSRCLLPLWHCLYLDWNGFTGVFFGVVWQDKEFKLNRNTKYLKSTYPLLPHRNVVVASESGDAAAEQLLGPAAFLCIPAACVWTQSVCHTETFC